MVLLFLTTMPSHAQILFNNGAQVTVKEGALVGVLGGLHNADGDFDNGGYVWIDGDLENDDVMSGNDGTVAVPSSTYVLRGDWINNSVFNAELGLVELDTSIVQEIRGSTFTIFHDLSLLGSVQYNKKIQFVDIFIDPAGTLMVNDAELATENSNVFVTNQQNTAITHNSGFISSLGDAYVSWEMSTTNLYEYPVGSSIGTLRKRVVQLTPETAALNTMGVRFANVEATAEGYDVDARQQDICEIIRIFYHRIYRLSGVDPMDINIQYVEADDGAWDFMVNWENGGAQEWDITNGSFSDGNFVRTNDWNIFADTAFAFGRELDIELTASQQAICVGDSSTITVNGPAGQYMVSWLSPADPSLPSGMQTLPLSFNVGPTTNTQYIVDVAVDSCAATDTVDITVVPPGALSISIGPDPAVSCDNGPITFTANIAGGTPGDSIFWFVNNVEQAGEHGTTFTLGNPSTGDVIQATYEAQTSCVTDASSNIVSVTTGDGVGVVLSGSGSEICVPEGDVIPLVATISAPSGGDVSITWTSDAELSCNSGCNTNYVTPIVDDTVFVVVSIVDNISGCTDTDSIFVCALDVPSIFVPTAFTPDGDTDNDEVFILGDLDEFDLQEFRIYNRWGEMVFLSEDFTVGWDGTFKGEDQEMDVYTWYVDATFLETQERRELKGVLALIR